MNIRSISQTALKIGMMALAVPMFWLTAASVHPAKVQAATTSAAAAIHDVGQSASYAQASIQKLASEHIITGDPNGLFHPQATLTRAEMADMIVKAMHLSTAGVGNLHTFTDVPIGNWAHDYVETAHKYGIINGIEPDVFGANQAVSREQMATIFTQALGLTKQNINGLGDLKTDQKTIQLDKFMDKSQIDNWAKDPTSFAVYEKMLSGTSASTFSPRDTAQRQQVAVVTDHFLSNEKQLTETANAFKVASTAKVSLERNGVNFTFSQPVKNLDIWFTDPRVVSINSRTPKYFTAPIGWENPYVSMDRTQWDFARDFTAGQPITLNYNVTLYNGDMASVTQQLTVPTTGLDVSSVSMVDASDVKVTFDSPIDPSSVSAQDFKTIVDQQVVEKQLVTTDSQSVVLKLASPLQEGQQLDLFLFGRAILPANHGPIQSGEPDGPVPPVYVTNDAGQQVDVTQDHWCPMSCGSPFTNRFPSYETILQMQDTTTTPPTIQILPVPDPLSKPEYIDIDNHGNSEGSLVVPETYINTVLVHNIIFNDPSTIAVAGNVIAELQVYYGTTIWGSDATNGSFKWSYYLPMAEDKDNSKVIAGSPTAVLFSFGDPQTKVRALSTADGKPMWSAEVDAPIQAIKINQGKAFILTTDKLYAYDVQTGAQLWSVDANGTTFAFNDTQVVIGTTDGQVQAYAYDGTPQFTTSVTNAKVDGLAESNGTWLVTQGKVLTALSASGDKQWSRTFAYAIVGGNVGVDSSAVYATFTNVATTPIAGEINEYFVDHFATVSRLDLTTGETIVSKELPYLSKGQPLTLNGQTIVVSQGGKLMILDSQTLAQQKIVDGFYEGPSPSSSVSNLGFNGVPVLNGDEFVGVTSDLHGFNYLVVLKQ